MEKKPTYEELEQRIRDLESEKNVKKKLCSPVEDQESMYRLILENISDTVIVTDNQGNMLYVCPNITMIFELSQDQVYKKKTIQRLMNGTVCNISELKNKHEIKGIEWSITNSYGKTLCLLINAKSVDINDGTVLYVMRDITDYKQFEKDLKKYKNIISSTLDGIAFLDENYRYIIVNDAYTRFSGIDRSQLIGSSVSKYLGEDVFKNIIKPNFDRCLQGEVINYQEWFEYPSLGKRFVDITYFPYREGGDQISGVIANIRDIPDRKNAEEETDKQKSLFETMFHTIPDGVILTNTQREILSSNKKIESIFGYKQEELQGKSTEILYANQDQFRKTGTAVFDKNAKKPGDFYVAYYRDKLGREFPGETLGAKLFDKNNKWIGNLGILRDITGCKQMEEALLADLKFFENIDKVNRAFQGTTIFEQMLSDVLDVVLTIFDCDRASLVFPCDPDTTSWSAAMERTKPEWPGALTLGLEVPMDPEVARIFRASRAADGPVEFGPGYKAQLPTQIAEQFNIQSQMTMALYPKTGQPWNFVLHQCSNPRVWTQEEKKLLTEIGRRMEDALTILLMYRNMRDSEKRLRRIIENTGAGYFFIDLDGNFQNVNASWLKMHGYISADEVIGRHFSVTQTETDLHQAKTIVEKLLSGKATTADEFPRQNKDGSIGYHSFSANPVIKGGGIVGLEGFLIDTTERKKAEVRLRESETKYRVMMESMDEATYICSSAFRIEYMNPAMIKKIGRDATGEQCFKAIYSLERQCDWCVHHKVMKGETIKNELKKSDTGEIFSVSHTPIYHPNGSVSKLSIYRDITERKKMEIRIQQAQKMESIGNLAGGIAHDFNNILSSILGFTELALDETPKGTVLEDSLQEVYSAGKRAKDLVKQILAVARQSEEKSNPIQPSRIVKEVLKLIRSAIPATIEIRDVIESESLIIGNATQIHQVLMNLLTNAAYAMEDKGGILEVHLKDVVFDKKDKLTGLMQGNYLEIKVSDTGVGIDPKIVGSIFEPYFTTRGSGEGTGLGLAMVQGIVESYGGKITVDSRLGKGTTFILYLPVTKKRSGRDADVQERVPTGKERILFVDDEYPIAKMVSQMLERLGYLVTTMTSSIEALALFRAKPNDFDLVVTDMTMPNLTGDKLAVELMKIRRDIPVILCTGYSRKISDETASNMGIRAFAYKPMVKVDLARTVRKVLNEAKGNTQE